MLACVNSGTLGESLSVGEESVPEDCEVFSVTGSEDALTLLVIILADVVFPV